MYNERLGENYVMTNMFREIIDGGVLLVGGSDSEVTDFNPLTGICAAVNHPVKIHRVSVYEALEMYTTKASYAIFEENIKGTLESGKLADVIILDRDILSAPQDAIDRIKVVATIKSGDIIYKKIKSEDIKIESKDI